MPKQYSCESCNKCFNKDKNLYKKHIKRCAMPLTAVQKEANKKQQEKQHLIEKHEKKETKLREFDEMPDHDSDPEPSLPSDYGQEGQTQYERRRGPYERALYQKYSGHPPFYEYWKANLVNQINERTYKQQRHARWMVRQEERRNPPPPPKKLNIHPLEGLLNNGGYYPPAALKPHTFVRFPEEEMENYPQFVMASYFHPLCRYIATHRRDQPVILRALLQLDPELDTHCRYLAQKTYLQWRYERLEKLRAYHNLHGHPQRYKYVLEQLQTEWMNVISNKARQLGEYYNRTIQCAPGATFFTELPQQSMERNFRHRLPTQLPPPPPPPLLVALPPKIKKIRPYAERIDLIRQKQERKRRRNPVKLYETHLDLPEDRIIEELNSQQYHSAERQSENYHSDS